MILRLARPALLLIGFILLRPSGGVAQTKADSSGVQDTTKSFSKATIEHKKKDVKIFLEKIDIFGKIEKPQTVFIIKARTLASTISKLTDLSSEKCFDL